MSNVYTRPGAASIRQAALWDAILELAKGGGSGGGMTPAEVQALIDASLVAYQALAGKGQPSGYAPLDAGGLVPNAYLPPLAITDTYVASSQAQMLALPAQTGDVCVRTDLNVTFILASEPASTAGNWQQILAPTGGGGAVISVNGYTGVVNLVASDVGALTQAQADARYPLLTAPDPYAQYLTQARGDARYPLATAPDPYPQYLTQAKGDARYSLTGHNHAGVYATPADVTSAITAHTGAADPHPTYLTAAEGNALYRPISYETDVTVTVNGSMTVVENPANTFALQVRLSPDAGNALALRGNGLYGTDTAPVQSVNTLTGAVVLTAASVGAATSADITAAINAHVAAGDPHTAYLNTARGDARYLPLAHAPGTDPHPQYLTQAEADLLYAAIGGGGTPEDIATLHREEWESPAGDSVTLAGVPDTLLTVARNGVEQANGGLHFAQAGAVLTFSDPFTAGERLVVTYAAGSAVAGTQAIDAYTKTESDARYEPIDTAYTKTESDGLYSALSHNHSALYEPLDSAYTKSESDGRYQAAGSYAPASHNHDALYEPLDAPYTKAEADAKYLILASGGTVAGATSFTVRPTVAGVAQPRISVQSGAPSTPATGDIWIW